MKFKQKFVIEKYSDFYAYYLFPDLKSQLSHFLNEINHFQVIWNDSKVR